LVFLDVDFSKKDWIWFLMLDIGIFVGFWDLVVNQWFFKDIVFSICFDLLYKDRFSDWMVQ
jgi:hypothetical protein